MKNLPETSKDVWQVCCVSSSVHSISYRWETIDIVANGWPHSYVSGSLSWSFVLVVKILRTGQWVPGGRFVHVLSGLKLSAIYK